MNQNFAIRVALFISLLLSIASKAVEIELKSTQHSTYVARGDNDGFPPASRTNFSFFPISDVYTNSDEFSTVESEADAELFMIFTFAGAKQHQSFPGFAEAFVETQFTFSPLSDALVQVQLEFFTKGQYSYGGNDVSLFDVTTDALLWNYYDQGFGGGNIPWIYDSVRGGMAATLTLPTQLLEAHDYRFKMSSRGSSIFPDFDSRFTQVSGLEVPEPTAFSMLMLAGISVGVIHRWRKGL